MGAPARGNVAPDAIEPKTKLVSGGAATRAQNPAIRVSSLHPAVCQHAHRRPQDFQLSTFNFQLSTFNFQLSTPSRLALDAPGLRSRGGEPMAGCGRRPGIAQLGSDSFCSPQVNLTMPLGAIRLTDKALRSHVQAPTFAQQQPKVSLPPQVGLHRSCITHDPHDLTIQDQSND